MTKATNPNTPKRKSPAACDSLPSNHNVKEPRKRSDKHPPAMKGQVVSDIALKSTKPATLVEGRPW